MTLLPLCDEATCRTCPRERAKPLTQRITEHRDTATSLMERYSDGYRPDFGMAAEFARLSLEANAILLGVK